MLRPQVSIGELAGVPAESTALFAASKLPWCAPRPEIGIEAEAPPQRSYGESSTEHQMPASPLGPAVAVALTLAAPAVESQSVGPLRLSETGVLSTRTVRPSDETFAGLAASLAYSLSESGPFGYAVVSTESSHVRGFAHCIHMWSSGETVGPLIVTPPTTAHR